MLLEEVFVPGVSRCPLRYATLGYESVDWTSGCIKVDSVFLCSLGVSVNEITATQGGDLYAWWAEVSEGGELLDPGGEVRNAVICFLKGSD